MRRLVRAMGAVSHYIWWRPRFREFGFRSRMGRCKMLTHPKEIAVGRRVIIRSGARLEAVGNRNGHPKIVIGDGTAIQFDVHIGAAESVQIGRNVLIAGRVYITDHDHVAAGASSPRESRRLVARPVVIEDGVWLGEGACVLKGVRIGSRAVVGANSVVTHDVPAGAVVGGVPARLIRA